MNLEQGIIETANIPFLKIERYLLLIPEKVCSLAHAIIKRG